MGRTSETRFSLILANLSKTFRLLSNRRRKRRIEVENSSSMDVRRERMYARVRVCVCTR